MSDVILECIDAGRDYVKSCKGQVHFHYALSPSGVSHPRCEHHWEKRLKLQEEIEEKYASSSDVPPRGFDPADAGESWDDDY